VACYSPLLAYRGLRNKNGKPSIVFDASKSLNKTQVSLPCGQCIGCRLDRSKEWALRCVHEASLYDDNCFITLTYAPEHLPLDGSLNKAHFQKFMKRLRKTTGAKIRYYHCGEYGEQLARPHYHALFFGYNFPDLRLHDPNKKLFTSAILSTAWGKGFCTVGEATYESAAYVARYILKKQTGSEAKNHYTRTTDTGAEYEVQPEYTTMSRSPGIGSDWYDEYKGDAFPSDFLVHRGKIQRVPKYYEAKFAESNPEDFQEIKKKRLAKAKEHSENNTPERLKVREKSQQLKLRKLKREIHDS